MDKKLFGSILTVLILLSILYVLAANVVSDHSPENYKNISATTYNFSVTIQNTPYNVSNCSWWYNAVGNDSAWTINFSVVNWTNTNVFSNASAVNGFAEGSYYWNITCTTYANGSFLTSGEGDKGGVSHTILNITFDRTAPAVDLQTPKDYTNSTSSAVSFIYNVTDSRLDIANCSLYLLKSGAWEKNTTDETIARDINQSINLTLADGWYLWYVACKDNANNIDNSSTRNLTVDASAPAINEITLPSYKNIFATESITIKCASTDPTAGIKSAKIKLTKPSGRYTEKTTYINDEWTAVFKDTETNEAGLYRVDCTIEDNFGTKGLAPQRTFSVFFADSGEEGVEEEAPVAKVDISTTEKYTGLIGGKQGESKTFTVDGTTPHTIEFIEITLTSATLKISSEPVEITLDVGKSMNVDLDGDGTDDVKVTLTSIEDGLAKVDVTNLAKQAEVEKGVVVEEETPTEEVEGKGNVGLWITILVIIIVIGVGYYLLKSRKGKKGEVKFSKQDLGL